MAVSALNLGDAKKIKLGDVRVVGTDPYTGEKIKRQRSFVVEQRCNGDQPDSIDDAIIDNETDYNNAIQARHPWIAAPIIITLADLYGSRALPERTAPNGTKLPADRVKAIQLLNRIECLCEVNMGRRTALLDKYKMSMADLLPEEIDTFNRQRVKDPSLYQAQILLARADLAIKQVNDGDEVLSMSVNNAIAACQSARATIDLLSGEKKDFFALGKSYILEAKLRSLRNSAEDTDDAITGVLEAGKRAIGVTEKEESGKKVYIVSDEVHNFLLNNDYVHSALRFYSYLTADKSLEKAEESLKYVFVWADLEEAKLVSTKVRVKKDKENAFKDEIAASVQKCRDCQELCASINKQYDYVNNEATLIEADLTAKLARLLPDNRISTLKDAQELYTKIADATRFNDIKARAKIGQFSLEIETGEFDWSRVKDILVQYFDPTADINNLTYPFNKYTYPFMSALHLECQLRNVAKRTTVVVPGCPTCEVTKRDTRSDYQLAASRARYIIDCINTNKIKYIRDKNALYDILARATLDEAQGTASMSMKEADPEGKKHWFEEGNKRLDNIFAPAVLTPTDKRPAVLAGETPETIESDPIDKKMEVSFYVAAWSEYAANLEQMAWIDNDGKRAKNTDLYATAIDKYNKALGMAKNSLASYDKVERKTYNELNIRKMQILGPLTLEFALGSLDEVSHAMGELDRYIDEIDNKLEAAQKMSTTDEFSDTSKNKYIANLKRYECEALCRKMFFVNKQNAAYLGGQKSADDSIKALYTQITNLAAEILPVLDETNSTVLNLLGINSVYMRLSKYTAADAIVGLYTKYIKAKDFETTYDMVDALANATVIDKNPMIDMEKDGIKVTESLKDIVNDYLDGMLLRTGTSNVTRAKLNVWKARMNYWLHDEKEISLEDQEALNKALGYYDEALKLYGALTPEERVKLFENGASTLTVMQERALVQFMYANASLKENKDIKAKMAQYQEIVNYIGFIDDGATIRKEGAAQDVLPADIAEKVGKQDRAAKIKAHLIMASLMMGFAEPMSKNLIKVKAAADISGLAVATQAELFTRADEIFTKAKNDIDGMQVSNETNGIGMTDAELVDVGIDIPKVYYQMAENYLTLALKGVRTEGVDPVEKINGMIDEGKGRALQLKNDKTAGRLEILRGNMAFWMSGHSGEAAGYYEEGFRLIAGKNDFSEVVAGNYEGLDVADLASYANALAVPAYKKNAVDAFPKEVIDKVGIEKAESMLKEAKVKAKSMLDFIIKTDNDQTKYGALARMTRADIVLANTDEDHDKNKSATSASLKDAVDDLTIANNVINGTKHEWDVVQQLNSIAISDTMELTKEKMDVICRLAEAGVRYYNTQVDQMDRAGQAQIWGTQIKIMNKIREMVRVYLVQSGLWDESQDIIDQIGPTIRTKMGKGSDLESVGDVLKKVPMERAVLIKSGRERNIPGANAEKYTDKDLP